jgi:hypothetical protein
MKLTTIITLEPEEGSSVETSVTIETPGRIELVELLSALEDDVRARLEHVGTEIEDDD